MTRLMRPQSPPLLSVSSPTSKDPAVGTPKTAYVDYQARASTFKVGDRAYSMLGGNPAIGGTVVAVWPAIGMVDLQLPHGNVRCPVEELVLHDTPSPNASSDIALNSVPGGLGTVPVSGGPVAAVRQVSAPLKGSSQATDARFARSSRRVTAAFVKKAVYWVNLDRKYRLTKEEAATGNICCPRCENSFLEKASYKKEEGRSVRLRVCPSCLFIIRDCDLEGLASGGV